MKIRLLVLIFNIAFVFGSLKYEKILHNQLLTGYNRDVRPEAGHEEPVHVKYDMVLQTLTSLNVKDQILELNAFATLSWYDPQLRWNVTEMDGVVNTTIGSEYIWTPDIVLYNNADDRKYFHVEIYKTKVQVQNDGNVIWNAPVTWKASCSCDVTWYPIDEQVCSLQFGSWTYSMSQLIVKFKEGADKQDHFLGGEFLVGNGEWSIEKVVALDVDTKFACCPEQFATIVYEIHLSRMTLYYMLYILLPLFSLVLLFLLVFHVEDGERMGFGVTVLLSITVYLLVISEKLPEKSDKYPMLGLCFIIEFYFLCIGLVIACFSARLAKRSCSRPPRFLLRYTLKFNKLFRSKSSEHEEALPMQEVNGNVGEENDEEEIRFKPEKQKKELSINDEWRLVARFVDKVCTLVFFLIYIIIPLFIGVILKAGEKKD